MNAEIVPEIPEYPEAGPFWVGLWAVARHWVGLLEDVFDPQHLATIGVNRRFALRCQNWLWAIEGLIRRLIIAAAMKLDAPRTASKATGKGRASKGKPASPSVSFTVLPRLAGNLKDSHAPRTSAPPPEHRHLAFPGDALLKLFDGKDKRPRTSQQRSISPLKRRGRISRWDPDYVEDPVKAAERSNRYYFGPFRRSLDCTYPKPPPRERKRADRSSPYWRPSGISEWRRIEEEWDRIIPAPRLAARINALIRVLQKPERWVASVARKLTADLVAKLRVLPPPRLTKPRLDRTPKPPLEAEIFESHTFINSS